jgi:curved DNA-binding protein CbpA
MSASASDPYAILGVDASVSDAELRAAYRRLVKQHHPDHNNGSEESERLFEAVQDAYARARALRAGGGATGARAGRSSARGPAGPSAGSAPHADDLDARLAAMENELREAQQARERAERARQEAIRAARQAAAAASGPRTPSGNARGRPTDEELGYYSTEDSISKILADAREALADRFDDLADRLKGDDPGGD